MARILIFQHVAHEILGTLDPLLRSYGARLRYVNFERDPAAQPSVQGYDGLIVLGGPMNVGEVTAHPHLAHERKAIEEAIRLGVPVLGICLGSQLVAAALGAAVYAAPEKEIGWYPVERLPAASSDPVLGPFAGTETVFSGTATPSTCPREPANWRDPPPGRPRHFATARTCTRCSSTSRSTPR
ncbi:MAG: gamma-glutamyl-gamma-aminobutyrate hydrolase family protein [Myxococcota bacterium]